MTSVNEETPRSEHAPRHASDKTAMTKRPGQPDHVGAHRRGTVYIVIHQQSFRDGTTGSLLADTGEVLATEQSGNIGWLQWDLKREAADRLRELYPAGFDLVVTPRDADVPEDVQQANRDWYATTAGATA